MNNKDKNKMRKRVLTIITKSKMPLELKEQWRGIVNHYNLLLTKEVTK